MSIQSRNRLARIPLALLVVVAAGISVVGGVGVGPALADDDQVAGAAWVTTLPCFGAAARDPRARCADARLRMTVFPSPDEALMAPNAPCVLLGVADLLNPCSFGSQLPQTATVGLLGDSHAVHWRAAVDVVARAQGWKATSLTFSGCPFSKARAILPAGRSPLCRRWNNEVLGWFKLHPEISTIFVSARSNARYARTDRGRSNFETAVQGHLALWRALPPTVRDIIVIRDTPVNSYAAQDCLRRQYAKGRPGGEICARARRVALHADPAATAARRMRARVHVLDMTPYFCDDDRCYPVIGGALVHKDVDHITATFARTLGPFMLQKVANITRRPR